MIKVNIYLASAVKSLRLGGTYASVFLLTDLDEEASDVDAFNFRPGPAPYKHIRTQCYYITIF